MDVFEELHKLREENAELKKKHADLSVRAWSAMTGDDAVKQENAVHLAMDRIEQEHVNSSILRTVNDAVKEIDRRVAQAIADVVLNAGRTPHVTTRIVIREELNNAVEIQLNLSAFNASLIIPQADLRKVGWNARGVEDQYAQRRQEMKKDRHAASQWWYDEGAINPVFDTRATGPIQHPPKKGK